LFILFSCSLFFLSLAFGNHYCGKTYGWDYSLYNQAFWKYSHFKVDNTIFDPPLKNFLQDHFSLTLFFFIPVYWLVGSWLTGTYTLLLIQAAFVSIGAVGTYKWVRLKTQNPWLSLVSMAHFFTIQGVLACFAHDYHDIVAGSCVIPLFLFFAESRKFWKSLACLFFIISSKENMPVVMLTAVVVLLVTNWGDKQARVQNLWYIIACITYLVLLFGLFIPMLSDPGRKSWVFKYYHLGNSMPEAVWYLVSHPVEAVKLLFVNNSQDPVYDGEKLSLFMAVFVYWGGLVLFVQPAYLLVLVPLVCQKVYSDNPGMWGLYIYYSIEICCYMPGAVYICLARFRNKRVISAAAVILLSINVCFTIYWVTGGYRVNWLAKNEKLVPVTSDLCASGRMADYREICEVLPADASISCTQGFLPHLSYRNEISTFPNVRDYQYVVMDTLDSYPFDVKYINDEKRRLLSTGSWKMIYQKGTILVMEKEVPR